MYWTQQRQPRDAAPQLDLEPKSPEYRRTNLAHRIRSLVMDGYRVEAQSDYQVILVSGKRPNHLLHLILTIVTLGIWLFVWIGVAIFGGERRRVVSIDEYGQLLEAER